MNIQEFVEMFITTYRLTHNAKLYKSSDSIVALFIEQNKIMDAGFDDGSEDLEIRLWIPDEDKIFINMLSKIYDLTPNIFKKYNAFYLVVNEKYFEIVLNKKNSSNLKWFDELLKTVKEVDEQWI